MMNKKGRRISGQTCPFVIFPILGHYLHFPKWVYVSYGYFLGVLIPLSLSFKFLGQGKDVDGQLVILLSGHVN